jgi:hydroxymethylglutaryl-CoA lyase
VEFTKRWLELGAHDVEHADHDGSASAPEVYRYFSMILDEIPDTKRHIAHFHETRRMAPASVLAALQAGITHYEATMGGLGGQPANFLDDRPVPGTGEYYYTDPRFVGLLCLEDLLVQVDEMGIEHGYDVDRILRLGQLLEKTIGRKLRSEAVVHGRKDVQGHPEFARPGLRGKKENRGESPGQKVPSHWKAQADVPEWARG